MANKKKLYKVEVAQVWSEEVVVHASSAREAKKLAWEKWKAKKKNYDLLVEESPEN